MTDFKADGIFPGILSKAFLTGVLLTAWAVQAASLGKLTVSSYLGQPLNAEIALESVTDKEIDSLSARLASPKIFQKAGVELAPYHATLSVSVEKRANGRPYIRISSSQAVNEPFLNLLIELSSSSGHLLREYNVLLDPAGIQKSTPVAPAVQPSEDGKTDNAAAPVKERTQVQAVSPAPAQTGNTYGPVASGDTLSRIARQVSSDSVNLNQMLVALYRANRDAFIEKNMNLLKVGVILRIPDESEVLSVTTREASREVAIQKESWDGYRQKIADLAGSASEKSGLKQSQTGKITTVSKESSVTGSDKPEEVLILSKGELIGDDHASAEKTESKTAQNYLHMMEEDAIAKERALQEANERVAILEQNVTKLQRLLELKESTAESSVAGSDAVQSASDLQKILTPEKQPGSATDSAAAKTVEDSIAPITIPAQPLKPAPSVKSPKLPQPADSESAEPDLTDTLLQLLDENSKWAAAGLGALLAIALGISLARRKRNESEDFDSHDIYDDAEKDDASVPSTLTEITSTDEKGTEEPDNGLTQEADGTSEPDDFANTADNRTDVDPGVFFAGKQDESIIESLFSASDSAAPDELNSSNSVIDTTDSDQTEYQLEVPVNTEEDTEHREKEPKEQWVFTAYDNDLEEKSDSVQSQRDDEIHTSSHDAEHQIDFDLKLPEAMQDDQETHVTNELSSSLADIDLDLGDKPDIASHAVSENIAADADIQWREVATKLDLAKAYLEMDDSEGARDILEEVLREGDLEQQSAARSMLDKIS